MGENQPSEPAARRHIPVLDGVRGVAIVFVFQFHLGVVTAVYSLMPLQNHADRIATRVMGAGWVGVDLFFVLSGFLITGILLDAREKPHYFRNFYARRFLRIFPMYYGFLLFGLLVLPRISTLNGALQDMKYLPDYQWWFVGYLANVPISIDGLIHAPAYPATHMWSLAIEEQFYVVWPAVVLVCGRRGMIGASIATIAASFAFRLYLQSEPGFSLPLTAYYFTPARLEPLAAGALVACLLRTPGALERLRRPAAIAGVLSIALLVWLGIDGGGLSPFDGTVQTIGFTALACVFSTTVGVLVAPSPPERFVRLVSNDVLMSIGRYSYAIYVVHLLVISQFVNRVAEHGQLPRIAGTALPSLLMLDFVAFTSSYGIAWVTWRLYESPFLRLKSRFGD